ncbi:hypothetical protein [Roseobacter sp.]|uniref:hypothetical protein n=1 Tax=Roseobacter sp. TaxID=1907202 RepID=UPI0029669613|nr:hypothetical protein [Roseobacter sp.]MDW3181762.1 hypothetical protein [Roseobacter sp.]
MKDDELTLIEDFRWWLGGLLPRWRGEEVTGVHASLAEAHAEIDRLQNHVAELKAALVPFAEVDEVCCGCANCNRNTLEIVTRRGRAVLQQTDFREADRILREGGQYPDFGVPV